MFEDWPLEVAVELLKVRQHSVPKVQPLKWGDLGNKNLFFFFKTEITSDLSLCEKKNKSESACGIYIFIM